MDGRASSDEPAWARYALYGTLAPLRQRRMNAPLQADCPGGPRHLPHLWRTSRRRG